VAEMGKRNRYPREFKVDAGGLVVDQGYSRAEAARNLGINANMLGRWVAERDKADDKAFRGNGVLSGDQEQIRELRKRVKRLEMEMEKDI